MIQKKLQVPLFSTQVIRDSLILFESMKGQQLDTNLFGLSSEQIHSQMHYLPARSLNTFLNYVIETQTDTFLISYFDSLLAKSVIPQFISTLVGTPKTLDEALPLMIAATKIQTPLSEIDFNIDSKHICLSRARVFHLYSNQNGADLFTLFFFKHFIKNMCGIEIPIQGVSLTSSASQKLISLLNALGITHYKFSQETQLYQIDNTYAKTTVSIRQSSSTEIKPAPVSYLDRIRAIIDSNLSDPRFSIQDLANQLGISVRTLQNTLQTQGSSFKTLKDERVLEHTIWLMLEDRLSITEVALELGYQNLPQFSRSIKRMTGLAPRALKSRLIK